MEKRVRIIVVCWAILVMLIGLFPPASYPNSGVQFSVVVYHGHNFLFAPLNLGSGMIHHGWLIETGRLLAEWGVITALAVALFVLFGRDKKQAGGPS